MNQQELVEATREIYNDRNRNVVQFKASPAMWIWMHSNATGDQDETRMTLWGVPVVLDELMPDAIVALDRDDNIIKTIEAT